MDLHNTLLGFLFCYMSDVHLTPDVFKKYIQCIKHANELGLNVLK